MKVKSVAGQANVRNMTCARGDECVGDNAHKEHCDVSLKNLSHTHEKKCACECVRGEV